MPTYLEMVNEVLGRLREPAVASVTTSVYTTLIGRFVNEAKYQVESAWDWDALSTTLTLNTVGGTSNYVLTGSGVRHKKAVVNDTTNRLTLQNYPIRWIQDQQQLSTTQNSNPSAYAWNGSNGTDSKVELWPTPAAVYALRFNLYVPQPILVSGSTSILIPSEAVVAGAYARAIAERGEDGGLAASEATGLYKAILSDQIAIEAARSIENNRWEAV